MKKIIGGKRYDTKTARLVAEYSSPGSSRDFTHYEESLYHKRTGEYFLAGSGGPMTKYAEASGQNSWSGGSEIIPLSLAAAREWAEERMDADEWESEFGQAEETAAATVGKRIKEIRTAKSMSQTTLAEAVGTHQARVADWESGGDMLTETLKKVAAALDIKPGELLN